MDSQPLTFTNWGPEEPSSSVSSCVQMSYYGTESWNPGYWKTVGCDAKLPYVCQRTLNPTEEDNPTQAPNPKHCPTDYYPWDTSCYKVMTLDKLDWQAAQDKCVAESPGTIGYSGLVTIWNEHEAQLVYSFFYNIDQPVWLGMTFISDPLTGTTQFTWNDNFPVLYTFWGEGQPNPSTASSGCVNFESDGRWAVSSGCMNNQMFLCKIETEFHQDFDDDLGEGKCDPGWSLLSSNKGEKHAYYCYQEHETPASWSSAQDECSLSGAYLMSVHSDYEIKFAQSIFGQDSVWLGGYADVGWEWIDGTAFQFAAWANEEPSNSDAGQCIEMLPNGQWIVADCVTNSRSFICQKTAEHSFCTVPDLDREQCGPFGVDENDCVGLNCCFDDTVGQCYHPDNTFECLERGGHCVSNSNELCNRGILDNDDVDDICPKVY